jgi:hypothetical protein
MVWDLIHVRTSTDRAGDPGAAEQLGGSLSSRQRAPGPDPVGSSARQRAPGPEPVGSQPDNARAGPDLGIDQPAPGVTR